MLVVVFFDVAGKVGCDGDDSGIKSQIFSLWISSLNDFEMRMIKKRKDEDVFEMMKIILTEGTFPLMVK